jgi:hypothetical protein
MPNKLPTIHPGWEKLRKAILSHGGLMTKSISVTMPTRARSRVFMGACEGIHPVRESFGFDVV